MKRYLSLFFLVATIVVNTLANALPMNGLTTGEISDRFDVYFTPAGYVFSIWGLIYLALLAFAVYQLLPGQKQRTVLDRVAPAFCMSCCANMAWIVLWHYQYFALTLVAMILLLSCLIWVWRQLPASAEGEPPPSYYLAIAPFSLYLGWISIALLANLAVVLEVHELRPAAITAEIWAIISICAGTGIAWAVTRTRQDLVYLGVFIWAYAGIVVARDGAGSVAAASVIGLSILLIYWLWIAARKMAIARHPS